MMDACQFVMDVLILASLLGMVFVLEQIRNRLGAIFKMIKRQGRGGRP